MVACCGNPEADAYLVRTKSAPGGDSVAITVPGGPPHAASMSALEVPERQPFEMEEARPAQIDTLDEGELASLQRLRMMVKFMDNGVTIPVVKYKFGADAVLGMVPYAGDAVGAIIGTYIMSKALKYHLPRRLVVRMAINQAIDTCGGVIPVLGDFFDFGYKANAKNLMLVEGHLQKPSKAKRADTCFLLSIFLVVVVVPLLLVLGILAAIIIGILAAFGLVG